MQIDWTDQDPQSGEKRFVRAERFARKWQFKVRFRRRTNWEAAPATREMWETLLDALERRYPRREGVQEEDLKQLRAVIAGLPASDEESSINHRDTEDTEEGKRQRGEQNN